MFHLIFNALFGKKLIQCSRAYHLFTTTHPNILIPLYYQLEYLPIDDSPRPRLIKMPCSSLLKFKKCICESWAELKYSHVTYVQNLNISPPSSNETK